MNNLAIDNHEINNQSFCELSVVKNNSALISKRTTNLVMQHLNYPNKNDIRGEIGSIRHDYQKPEEIALINSNIGSVVEAILGKANNFSALDTNNIGSLSHNIINSLSTDKSLNNFIINVGMGASELLPSVRTPAYLLPAIQMIQNLLVLKNKGVIHDLPKVHVFKADYLGSMLNGFNLDKSLHSSHVTFQLLQKFLDEFYPEIKQYFEFSSDKKEIMDVNGDLFQTVEHISQKVGELQGVSNEITQLLKMGEKHGGEKGMKNALIYAAAHPLYNGYYQTKDQTSVFNHSNTKTIIDIGGQPQMTFNTIMHQLVDYLELEGFKGNKIPCVTAISKVGKVPVYYRARQGDIGIEDTFSLNSIKDVDRKVQGDYKALGQAGINPGDFEQFINDFKTNNNI